jgi:outer membrane protein assembly factor BamA
MARSIPGPGFSNHVASLKLSFGAAKGTGADSQHFTAGGTPGNALMLGNVEVIPGRRFLFPIRGYFEGVRAGKYAWAGSAEYRVPLKNVDRGLGLVPSHLDRVSGSVFLDGGNAWGVGMDEAGIGRQKTLLASGVEIQSSVSLFFTNPLFLRAGYAVQLDQQNGRSFYFRLGTIF